MTHALKQYSLNEARSVDLTPEDLAADALLSLETRERYVRQHAATEAGHPAPLPPRPQAHRHLQPVF